MFLIKSIERLRPLGVLTPGRMRRIAGLLFMNTGLSDNPGMLNGKMGIAIFLYHYARSTRSKMYDRIGIGIDELQNETI